jgi:hypothetical protein
MNPGDAPEQKNEVPKQEASSADASTTQEPTPPVVTNSPTETAAPSAPAEETTWYHPNQSGDDPEMPQDMAVALPEPEIPDVQWTASEYIAHEKSVLWYVAFVVVAIVVGALAYLVTKDIVMVVVVLVAFASFGVMATRNPRMRDYALDSKGVHIGEKFYPYNRFKSYSLATLGDSRSVDFMPLERFRPPITIYMSDEQESMILAKLSGILPYEERRQDTVDWLMHRLRF